MSFESAEFIMTYIMPYIPLVALVIGLGMFFYGAKNSFDQRFSEQIKEAKPYTDVQISVISVSRKNYRILSLYVLYFIIIIPVLVHFFGKIEYGPNKPYTLFLIIVGIPFLIAFAHVFILIDNQRCRLIASGLSVAETSKHVGKWMLLFLCAMIFVIDIILKLSNKFIS